MGGEWGFKNVAKTPREKEKSITNRRNYAGERMPKRGRNLWEEQGYRGDQPAGRTEIGGNHRDYVPTKNSSSGKNRQLGRVSILFRFLLIDGGCQKQVLSWEKIWSEKNGLPRPIVLEEF